MYNLGSKIIAYLSNVDKLIQGKSVAPITCEIDPSNFCRNSCEWCIYAEYISKNRVHLDYTLFEDILYQLFDMGCKSITFTGGGEPTCHPQFNLMISFALKLGFKIGLITNGIGLDLIKDYWNDFEFIRVSLDHSNTEDYYKNKKTHYFDKICRNIFNVVQQSSTDIGISAIYTTEKDAQDFIDLGSVLGVKYTQIKPLVNNKVETTNTQLNQLNKDNSFATERYLINGSNLPCKIAGLIGQVGADGKYYYCCIHRGNPKYVIGDLRTESLQDLIEKRKDFIPDLDDCFSCRYMNYAKEYEKVLNKQYQMLRHIDFL